MSVYKEIAKQLENIENYQRVIPLSLNYKSFPAFKGMFNEERAFTVGDAADKKFIDQIRDFCKAEKQYAKITTSRGINHSIWTFETCLDEGPYGWNVVIQKYDTYVALSIKPFSRYEA